MSQNAVNISRVVVEKHGFTLDDAVLRVVEEKLPAPGADEALVRVVMRPVNPADMLIVNGVYPGAPKVPNLTPGLEGVGVIEALGSTCAQFFKVGERVSLGPGVVGNKGLGTFSTHVLAKFTDMISVPDNVPDTSASQMWVNPIASLGMYKTLDPPRGSYVLSRAAASALGRQFIQIAKHHGVKTINVVRRPEVAAELRALGADEVIVESELATKDLATRVREITGEAGAFGAIEPIADASTAQVIASVRDGGLVLVYGSMGGIMGSIQAPVYDILVRCVSLSGWNIYLFLGPKTNDEKRAVLEEIRGLFADKVVTTHDGQSFPLANVKEALAESMRPGRNGKVFLV